MGIVNQFEDSCEWNPTAGRAAYWNESHAPASVIVGKGYEWRLCENCAALPQFSGFAWRKPIESAVLPPTAGGRGCSEIQQPTDGILVKKPGYDILSVDNAAKQMMDHLGAALVKFHDAPCSAESHIEQAVRLLARVTAYAYVPGDAEAAQAIKDAINVSVA